MNIASLASIFRHWLTAAAGVLGLWLIAALAFSGDEAKQLTDALALLIEPTVAILGLIVVAVSRLAITWIGKLFGRGAGENGDPMTGLPVWVVMGAAAGLFAAALPSCGSNGEYTGPPVKATFQLKEGALSYSSKGGLEMEYRPGYGEMPDAYRKVDRKSSK
jgi:hypothetical protein